MKKKILLLSLIYILILCGVAFIKTWEAPAPSATPQFYARQLLESKVFKIAGKYSNGEAIVVSKKDHLLYYCRRGFIVRGDRWGGFVYDFPVPVSLGVNNNWTPEGEFKVYLKNPQSRYTLFLGFLGLYGIHGAETHLASRLNTRENLDPDYTYVTLKDRTRGCVAVENRVIRYLYAKVDLNTPVLIMP